MSPRTKLLVYGNLVIFGGVFVGAVIVLVREYKREKERAPFQAQIEEYLVHPTNELTDEFKLPKKALKIPGKIIIVDTRTKRIDPAFNDLPAQLKPANPDDVKTVVWVEYLFKDTGKYNDGTTAYRTNARLTVIDATSQKYLWLKTVEGRSPPEKRRKDSKDYIEYPAEEIVRYLNLHIRLVCRARNGRMTKVGSALDPPAPSIYLFS